MKVDIALESHPNQMNMLEKFSQISDTFNPFIDDTVWKKFIDERIAMVKRLMETCK